MTTIFHIEPAPAVPARSGFADPRDALSGIKVTPRVRPSGAGDEADRTAFEAALTRISTGRYWLLTLARTQNGWVVRTVSEAMREFRTEADIIDLPHWLAERRKESASAGFYASRGHPAADAERICASGLLREAAAWTAPIPQKLGLVALLSHAAPWPATPAALVLLDAAVDDPQPEDFTVTAIFSGAQPEGVKIVHADGTCCQSGILYPCQPDIRNEDADYPDDSGPLRAALAELAYAAFLNAGGAEGPVMTSPGSEAAGEADLFFAMAGRGALLSRAPSACN